MDRPVFIFKECQNRLAISIERYTRYLNFKIDIQELTELQSKIDASKLINNSLLLFSDFNLDDEEFDDIITKQILLKKNVTYPVLILSSNDEFYFYKKYYFSHLRQNLFFLKLPFNISEFKYVVNKIKEVHTQDNVLIRERHFNFYHYLSRKLDKEIGGQTYHGTIEETQETEKNQFVDITKLNKKIEESIKYKNDCVKLNWSILVIDDQFDTIDEKVFFAKFEERIKKLFGDNTSIWELKNFASRKDTNNNSKYFENDLDIVFLDVINSENGSEDSEKIQKRFESLFTILPYYHERRYFNSFPILIMLSHDKRFITRTYALRHGADFFINKGEFFYDALEAKKNVEEFITYLIATHLSIRDWEFDKLKYENANISYEDYFVNKSYFKFFESDKDGLTKDDEIEMKKYVYLLSKLFSHIPNINKVNVVKRFNEGLSGSFVGLAKPYYETSASLSPRIIKIDTMDKMIDEKYNYDKYIVGKIDNFCGRVEPLVASAEDLAAISYTKVGLPEDYEDDENTSKDKISDLEKELKGNLFKSLDCMDESCLIDKIDFIFGNMLKPLHESSVNDKVDISKYYHSRLPAIEIKINEKGSFESFEFVKVEIKKDRKEKVLLVKGIKNGYKFEVNGLGEEFFNNVLLRRGKRIELKVSKPKDLNTRIIKVLREKINEEDLEKSKRKQESFYKSINSYTRSSVFLNPFNCYKKIDQELTNDNNKSKIPFKISIIHGDLNLRNLLYTKSTDSLWIIDFAETRPGHTCSDYTIFEIEFRIKFLVDEIVKEKRFLYANKINDKLKYFVERVSNLEYDLLNLEYNKLEEHSENVNRLSKLILFVREKARKLIKCSEEEYLISLYYNSLRTIKYEMKSRIEIRKNEIKNIPIQRFYVYLLAGVVCKKLKDMSYLE